MADDRSSEYHEAFWREVNKHPDTAQRFKESGYDWNKLSSSDRHLCQGANEIAEAEARRKRGG